MLKLSLAANAALAILCAALYFGRKAPEKIRVEVPVEKIVERIVEAPISPGCKNEIENAAVKAYRARLAKAFPDASLQNVRLEWAAIPEIATYAKNSQSFPKVDEFLRKLEHYVLFVNTNLLEKTTP